MKKQIILVCMLVFTLALSGCSLFRTEPVSGTMELTDDFDREITLEQPAERIISLAPATTEILFALGVGERIVGATEYCNYPEAALDIPRMGAFDEPNLELMLSKEPDLVLAASLHKETVEALEDLDVPVLALDPDTFEEIYANIRLLAKATGTEAKGEELIADMEARLEAVVETFVDVAEEEKPVVYYEVWYPEPMTAGQETFIDIMINLAGGRNLAHDMERYPTISEEILFERNPALIVHGHSEATVQDFAERTGWTVIEAVQTGNIHYVDQDVFNRPGPRMVEAVETMAKMIHPERYE
ncbi:MAG: ABC transporter substrate-binding protein [Firmicutes bacterium]|nr:ABC transporter substrate-binding protein [Bacillota bacterium]